MSLKRKADEMETSDVEEIPETDEEETSETEIQLETLIEQVFSQRLPISDQNIIYLTKFLEFYAKSSVMTTQNLSMINKLKRMIELIRTKKKSKKSSLTEFLKTHEDLLGDILHTSIDLTLSKKFIQQLHAFENSNPQLEVSSSSALTNSPSKQPTIAHFQTEPADAHGEDSSTCSQALMANLITRDIHLTSTKSTEPDWKPLSHIIQRVGGSSSILQAEDSWKQYQVEIKLWDTTQLIGISKQDAWRETCKKFLYQFSAKDTQFCQHLAELQELIRKRLVNELGASWTQIRK